MTHQDILHFDVHVDLAIVILKTQDKTVVESFKRGMKTLVDTAYLKDVVIAAFHYLADLEPEIFTWALHHYDSNLYLDLRRQVAQSAVCKLIKLGLKLGEDFSCLPIGGLIIPPAVKPALLKEATPLATFLLREILFISDTSPA